MFKVSQLAGFGAGVVGAPKIDRVLLESGDFLLLEDGNGLGLEGGIGSIAVTRVSINTTTGTQDIVVAGFGTPKLALFTLSHAITDGVVRDGINASFGAADGTNEWAVSCKAQHNVGNSNTSRRSATDEIAFVVDGGSGHNPTVEINFDSFIANGVRINIGLNDGASAYLLTVTLFRGDDLAVEVGTKTLATDTNTVTVTPGFELNALITGSSITPVFGDTTTATAFLSMGFASYDGDNINQTAFVYRSNDAAGAAETVGDVRTDGVITVPADRFAILENITDTAFDIRSSGFTSWELGYVAIGLSNGAKAWAGILDSPTGTGNNSWTGVGFRPTFGALIPNMITAVDTAQDTGEASSFGVYHFTESTEYITAWADEDGATTMNAQLLSDDSLNLDDDAGSAAFDATFVSFDSDGATLNFSVADGTPRKWPALFIAI